MVVKKTLRLRPPDPDLVIYTPEWAGDTPRTAPFLTSLLIHTLIVSTTFILHYTRPPKPPEPESAEQLLQDDHYKLTWNYMRDDLPPVEPAEPQKVAEAAPKKPAGDSRPPRFKLPQEVVADDPNAVSNRQMIYDQAPEVELARDVSSPNFIEPPMPAIQRQRFEVTPEQPVTPGRQALAAETVPQVAAKAPDAIVTAPKLRYWEPERQTAVPGKQALAVENAPKLTTAPTPLSPDLQPAPKLRYWTAENDPAAPNRQALTNEAAPAIKNGPADGLDISAFQKLSRLRYFSEEKGEAEPGKQTLGGGEAPQIAAAPSQGVDVDLYAPVSRLRYQDMSGGQNNSAAPAREALGERAPVLGTAPGDQRSAADLAEAQALASLSAIQPPPGANGTTPGRAVVGVDPDSRVAPADVPRGQRGGNFTAGPDGGANTSGNGGAADGADAAAMASLRVPHLSVSPPTNNAGVSDGRQPSNLSGAETEREALLRKFRNPNLAPVSAVGAVAPDKLTEAALPLLGRAVYTLAVNMPNISSYSGSWIIQFAELSEDKGRPGTVMPPSPRLKVDPVYSRAAMDEHIEGEVILHALIRSDGVVDKIELLKKLDDRLDESAATALGKWRFNPATKDGVPIDVETVVSIPFRLISLEDKKRR